MGLSSGLFLVMIAGSMSRGSRRAVWATLVWTSWSATSMFRLSSNSTVMLAEPWREVEVICLTPSTVVMASSM